ISFFACGSDVHIFDLLDFESCTNSSSTCLSIGKETNGDSALYSGMKMPETHECFILISSYFVLILLGCMISATVSHISLPMLRECTSTSLPSGPVLG